MKILPTSASDILLTVLFLIISLALTFFYYRKVNLPKNKKAILISLRALSIFLILMLLLNPFIKKAITNISKPVNIILIDNSLSSGINRISDEESDIILKKLNNSSSSDYDLRVFSFGSGIISELDGTSLILPDTNESKSYSTNLARTFDDLRRMTEGKGINSVTVISDGIINDGGVILSEARILKAPVNYYLTGDTSPRKDVSITELQFNKTVPAGTRTKIIAVIKSRGFDKKARIFLKENGQQIQSTTLDLKSDIENYSAGFDVMHPTAGIINYEAEIEFSDGEATVLNNKEDCYIKFISSSRKYMLISGGPSADFAFFSQMLKGTEGIETDIFTLKTAGSFYEGIPDIQVPYDLIILFGYPSVKSETSLLQEIRKASEVRNIPLIFFDASYTDYAKLKEAENILPFNFSSNSKNETETTAQTTLGDENSDISGGLPATDISGMKIFKAMTGISAKPGTVTLLNSSVDYEPVLMISKTEERKSAAFLGYGIFKWRLGRDEKEAENKLRMLFNLMASSISDAERSLPFTVETDKQKYISRENIFVRAYLKNPQDIAENVLVTVSGIDTVFTEKLKNSGSGYFESALNINRKGEYRITAEAITGGSVKYSDSVKINTGSDYREFRNIQPDKSVLSGIASLTGGTDLTRASDDEIKESLNRKYIIQNGEKEEVNIINLRNYSIYLITVILLFSLEWYLRKRYNLS